MSEIVNIRQNLVQVAYRLFRWHVDYYLSGRGFPVIATFQITNRCNLRCLMCNIPNNPEKRVLPLETFTRIVEDLSGMGCCYVSLSGGEIFTVRNAFEYLAIAKKNIPSVNVVTNGILVDKEVAEEIGRTEVDSVSISLDGMKTTHDYIRGDGTFDRVVDAIETIKTFCPGIKIVVNTVITPWNMDDIYELTDFVESLGVLQKFQPLNEHPVFEGQRIPYRVPDLKAVDRKKIDDLIRFLIHKKNVVNSRYFLKAIPRYFRADNKKGLFKRRCILPRFYCEFREDGRMYPCIGGMGWKGGFGIEDGVMNTFYSDEYRTTVRRLETCRLCQRSLSVCYVEPRVVFPLPNFFRYTLISQLRKS